MNPAVWKDTVTAYTYRTEPDTGLITYDRHILRGCFWTEDIRDERKRGGTAVMCEALLLIPYTRMEGVILSPGPDEAASYLLPGVCLFEFTPGEGDDFTRTQIRPFEETYQLIYKRPKEIIPRYYGSRRLWHAEIRC